MVDIVNLATELCKAVGKEGDKALPAEIADVMKKAGMKATLSSWVPLPGADVALGVSLIQFMYRDINEKLGLSFEDSLVKACGARIVTNLTNGATLGAGSALKLLGVLGMAGAVVVAPALYALTMTSGVVYLKAFSTLAQREGINFDFLSLRDEMNKLLADKEGIEAMLEDFKKEYSMLQSFKDMGSEAKKSLLETGASIKETTSQIGSEVKKKLADPGATIDEAKKSLSEAGANIKETTAQIGSEVKKGLSNTGAALKGFFKGFKKS